MLDSSVLRTFRTLVATPCFGGSICLNYVLSIINFQRECAAAGMGIDFYFNPGDSLVTRARNDCVAYFLSNNSFTHLFWIDADIGFSPQAAFRLLLCDRDVAAGVYPLKREDWPAEGVPHGTTRQKFEELYQRYPVNTGRLGEDVDLIVDGDGFMKVRERIDARAVKHREWIGTDVKRLCSAVERGESGGKIFCATHFQPDDLELLRRSFHLVHLQQVVVPVRLPPGRLLKREVPLISHDLQNLRHATIQIPKDGRAGISEKEDALAFG
jgi:hypothetical protein